MQILLTFDYELYFGRNTGTVERCMTGPTDALTRIADDNGIRLCHFVDIGFILKLEEESKKNPGLSDDYDAIRRQLEQLAEKGHDLQLHIHPHWEDSRFHDGKWECDTRRYRLHDFSDAEIGDIVTKYKNGLERLTGKGKVFAYRAGGWCVQPFDRIGNALKENGILVDSSVFPGGHFRSELYDYDFRESPSMSSWRFSDDPLSPEPAGKFTELPIASIRNSPLFYWRLFLLGRLDPHRHKPLGDGVPVPAPGQRRRLLTRPTVNTVSVDGYNAHLLERALRLYKKKNMSHMVVIGHPKALTRYGIDMLECFIRDNKSRHQFTTFAEQRDRFV